MTRLGENLWGKSEVRVSKIHAQGEDFVDATVQVLLGGDVEAAYREGDNAAVLPTDTMRNTVYALAQEHLTPDLEAFAGVLAEHFTAKPGVRSATIEVSGRSLRPIAPGKFVGGSTERRRARIEEGRVWAGISGLELLKTTGSSFTGFPRDEYTTLEERDDRVLATAVDAWWRYTMVPDDTTAVWRQVREIILERFFGDWSASVQHQGWQIGEAILLSVPDVDRIDFRLPNQHHLGFAFERLGLKDRGVVFHPVSEPYGDIRFTVER